MHRERSIAEATEAAPHDKYSSHHVVSWVRLCVCVKLIRAGWDYQISLSSIYGTCVATRTRRRAPAPCEQRVASRTCGENA